MSDDIQNPKKRLPDDLSWVEEADKLHPSRGTAVSRTNGVIFIVVGLVFVCLAVASDWNIVYRILPAFGGITMILMGIGAVRRVL